MSTYANFAIQNETQLKQYILRKLGAPLITVELTNDQLTDAINDATELFSKYVNLNQEFQILSLSGYVTDNSDPTINGIKLPDKTIGIFSIDPYEPNTTNVFGFTGMGGGLIYSMYTTQMYGMIGSNGFYNDSGFSFGTQANISNFKALARVMTGKGYDFNFDPRTKYLTLYPQPDKCERLDHSIILGIHYVSPEENMYGEHFIKNYALAKAKEMLGLIRKKYSGVTLPGGGTVDASIGDEGREEVKRLEEELVSKECNIMGFFVG